jgi:hypothetical protein
MSAWAKNLQGPPAAALKAVQRWSSVRGWCSEPAQGGVGGEEMALGAGAGAEWSGVPTGFIVGSCGGSARNCVKSATGDVVGVGLGGGERRGGGT